MQHGGPGNVQQVLQGNMTMHGMQYPGVPFGHHLDQREKDPNISDQMSQSMSQSMSESFSKKRKRDDDDDPSGSDDDSQSESKKIKTDEQGHDESKIHQGLPFDSNTMFTPPSMQQMQLNQGQFPQGGNMQHLPSHLIRGGPPPGSFYPGPFYMNKPPGYMQGENPPNYPQMPFVQNPIQMMYKPENIVEVEPYFQQLLMKNPPSDGLTEKLPSSKTPVIDAFIYCAICNWGVMISPTQDRLPSTFTINDFNKYWDFSQKICSKPSPTETPVARLKALRRWFADFPGIKKIKAVKEGKEPIVIKVKPERIADVIAIVKKYSQIINTRCRTLVQSTINHQPSFSNNMGGDF